MISPQNSIAVSEQRFIINYDSIYVTSGIR